jgi:hypothetical protein
MFCKLGLTGPEVHIDFCMIQNVLQAREGCNVTIIMLMLLLFSSALH